MRRAHAAALTHVRRGERVHEASGLGRAEGASHAVAGRLAGSLQSRDAIEVVEQPSHTPASAPGQRVRVHWESIGGGADASHP